MLAVHVSHYGFLNLSKAVAFLITSAATDGVSCIDALNISASYSVIASAIASFTLIKHEKGIYQSEGKKKKIG